MLTQLNTAVAKVGVPPGYSAVLFCCRTLAFPETPAPLFRYCRSSKKKKGVSVSAPSTNLPQLPMCGSKREEQGIPQFPQLLKPPYAVEWTRPTGEHPKPLVKGGKRHFKQSLKCRRQSLFLLHHQKAHSLFDATDRGPHKSPAKRVLWGRGGATKRQEGCPPPQGVPNIAQFDPTTNGGFEAAAFAAPSPRPETGRISPPPRGGPPQSPIFTAKTPQPE